MGGAAFSRMALYVFSFVGIFALLFALIPPAFFAATFESSVGADKETADLFQLANVTLYDNIGNDNMTYEYGSYLDHPNAPQFSAGLPTSQYLEVVWTSPLYVAPFVRVIEFRHIEEVWWGRQINDRCSFTGMNGTVYPNQRITKWNVIDEYNVLTNGSSFSAQCNHITVSSIFEYNQTKYTDIGNAWDGGELSYTFSYEADWNASQVSAMTVLGKLLTFQAPALGITGVAGIILNAMVAIPIWVMTAILIIKLVQSVIPFIQGLGD